MDVLYIIENNKNDIYKIRELNINNCKSIKINIEMVKMLNKIKMLCDSDKEIKYLYNSTCFISLNEKNVGLNYICKIFEIDEKGIYYIKSEEMDINKKSEEIETYILKGDGKVNNNCKDDVINKINYILKKMNGGNNIIFEMYIDEKGINILNILSLIFSKVVIIYGRYILCIKKDEKSKYMGELEKKDKYLEIELKGDVNKLKKYLSNMYKEYEKMYKSVLEKNENMVYKISYNFYNEMLNDKIIKKMDKDNILKIYLERFFIETSRRFFINKEKNDVMEIKIHSAIKKEEGENIQKIISKYNVNNCLEIGMAYGISAFYILTTKKGIKLTSIDPYQRDVKQWNSMGINLIKYLKLDKRHNLIEELSYIGLPKLLNKKNKYDFIFIDGWHTFDYTLIDFFYADKLLKLGGIILIDDVLHKGVNKFIRYVETNYKNYKKIETIKTQAGYIKMGDNKREWYYHVNF
jgi:predicted O-methyltransferase YrrM